MNEFKVISNINDQLWQMSLSERLFVVSIVAFMRPARLLELGVWMGMGSQYFKKYCGELYRIDVMKVDPVDDDKFYNMRSDDSFKKILKDGLRFDMAIIDADHSEEQAERDMDNALQCCDMILMHDTFNEPCRKGYVKGLYKNQDKVSHVDFDVIHGREINGEKWGGIGMVVLK